MAGQVETPLEAPAASYCKVMWHYCLVQTIEEAGVEIVLKGLAYAATFLVSLLAALRDESQGLGYSHPSWPALADAVHRCIQKEEELLALLYQNYQSCRRSVSKNHHFRRELLSLVHHRYSFAVASSRWTPTAAEGSGNDCSIAALHCCGNLPIFAELWSPPCPADQRGSYSVALVLKHPAR